jgi:hypothetical protein
LLVCCCLLFFTRPFRRDRPRRKQLEDAMKEMTQQQIETPHASIERPVENDEDLAKLAQAMRRALKRAANYAMRHDNAAEAANETLALYVPSLSGALSCCVLGNASPP